MSFATNVTNLATRIGTEFKSLRTLVNGNRADLSELATTDKSHLVAAINEVWARPEGGAKTLTELSDVTVTNSLSEAILKYDIALGRWVEVDGLTMFDAVNAATIEGGRVEQASQPRSEGLSTIAQQTGITPYGVVALTFSSPEEYRQWIELHPVASTGDANDLTGLAPVAISGDAGDLTGILPPSSLPPLGINEVFVVASQSEMLALVAERGDMAIRTDANEAYALATDSPNVLGDWKRISAVGTGDVMSVNGYTGHVVLVKSDVGLTNVDDVKQQPINANLTSIAGQSAVADRMLYATGPNTWALATLTAYGRSLNGAADAAAARGSLSVYSQAEIGNPETDFVAIFNAALV